MTDQEKIEELKAHVPKVQLTTRQKVVEVIGWVCSATAVVALIVGLFAAQRAANVSACINQNLGSRNLLSVMDARAHIAWAQSLGKILSAPKAEQTADYLAFVRETGVYASTLASDQAARDAHPLGQC